MAVQSPVVDSQHKTETLDLQEEILQCDVRKLHDPREADLNRLKISSWLSPVISVMTRNILDCDQSNVLLAHYFPFSAKFLKFCQII